ncbi:hypothetical protein HDU89_000638 [Geranomyces variabilis]|nr:hypothetical protein HDU89_000638 [Geranomyces variabilis]
MSLYGGFGLSRRASVASTTAASLVKGSVELGPTLPESFIEYQTTSVRSPTPLNPKKLNSLQLAAYNGDVNKIHNLMMEKKRDVDKLDTVHKITALHIAAERGDTQVTKALITGGRMANGDIRRASLDVRNQDGRTALILAAMFMKSDIVLLLVASQAQLDILDTIGCGALHYALLNNDRTSFEALVQAGASIRIMDKTMNTLLHHAVRMGHDDICKSLIEAGADVNIDNAERRTPLHLAVQFGHGNVVQLLLEHNADINLPDSAGQTADDLVDPGNYQLMELLLSKKLGQKRFAALKRPEVTRNETDTGDLLTAVKTTVDNDENSPTPQSKSNKSPGLLSESPIAGKAANQESVDSTLFAAEPANPAGRLGLDLVYEASEPSLHRTQRNTRDPVLSKTSQTPFNEKDEKKSVMPASVLDETNNSRSMSGSMLGLNEETHNRIEERAEVQSEVSESLDLDTELLDALDDNDSPSISDLDDDEISVISPASPQSKMSEPEAVQEAAQVIQKTTDQTSLISEDDQREESPLPLAGNAQRRALPTMSVRIDARDSPSQKKAVKLDPGELTATANRLLVDLKLIEQKYAGQDEISSVVSVLVNYVRDTNEIALAADEDNQNYKLLWKALRCEMDEQPSKAIVDGNVSPDRREVVEFVQKLRNRRNTEATIAGSPTSPMSTSQHKGGTNIKSPKQWAETKHAQLSYEVKALHEWIEDAKHEVLEETSSEHEAPEDASERAILEKETTELKAKRRALLAEFAGLHEQQLLPTLPTDASTAMRPASSKLLEGDAQALARSLAAEQLVNQQLTEELNALKTDHDHLLSCNSSLEKRLDELQDEYLKFNAELALKQYEFEMAETTAREAQYREAELAAEEYAALEKRLICEREERQAELQRARLELQQVTEKLADEVRQRELSNDALEQLRAEYGKVQAELTDAESRVQLQLDVSAKLTQKLEQVETTAPQAQLDALKEQLVSVREESQEELHRAQLELQQATEKLLEEARLREMSDSALEELRIEHAKVQTELREAESRVQHQADISAELSQQLNDLVTSSNDSAASIAEHAAVRAQFVAEQDTLRSQIESVQVERNLIQVELEETAANLDLAKTQTAELIQERDTLAARCTHLEGTLETLVAEVDARKITIDSLTNETAELRNTLQALTVKANEVGTTSENLVKYYDTEMRLLAAQIASEKELRIARDEEHVRISQTVAELEASLSQAAAEHTAWAMAAKEAEAMLNERLRHMTDLLGGLEADVEERTRAIDALEREKIELNTAMVEAQAAILNSAAELNENNEEHQRMFKRLEEDKQEAIQAFTVERDALSQTVKELTAQMAEQHEATHRVAEENLQAIKSLEQERDSLTESINDLMQQVLNLQQTARTLEEQRVGQGTALDRAEAQIDKYQETVNALEAAASEHAKGIEILTEDKLQAIQTLEQERDALALMVEELTAQTAKQHETMHAVAEEKQQAIMSLEQERGTLIESINDLKDQVSNLRETARTLEEERVCQVTALEQEIDAQRKEITVLREQNDEAGLELVEAKSALAEEREARVVHVAAIETERDAQVEAINALRGQESVAVQSALAEEKEARVRQVTALEQERDSHLEVIYTLREQILSHRQQTNLELLEAQAALAEEQRAHAQVIASLEEQDAKNSAELHQADEKMAKYQETIKALEGQVLEHLTRIEVAEREIAVERAALVKADAVLAATKAENENISEVLAAAKTRCAEHEIELRDARATIALLETEIKGLEEARRAKERIEIDIESGRLTQHEADKKRANVAENALRLSRAQLQTALHEKKLLEDEVSKLQEEAPKLRASVDAIEVEKLNLQAALTSVTERARLFEIQIRDKENEHDALTVNISQLMTQIDASQAEIRRCLEGTAAAEMENERLESQLQKSKLEKNQLEVRCKALRESLTQSELQIEKLSRELWSRKQEIHELAHTLDTIKHDHAAEVNELRTELASVTLAREALSARLSESQQSLERIQMAIAELQHTSSRDCDELKRQLTNERQASASLEIDHARMSEELRLLRAALEKSHAQVATLTSSEIQSGLDRQELQKNLSCKEASLKQKHAIIEYNSQLLTSSELRVEVLLAETRRLQLEMQRLHTLKAQWETERQNMEHEFELCANSAAATEIEFDRLQRAHKQVVQKMQALEAALFEGGGGANDSFSEHSSTAMADASMYKSVAQLRNKVAQLHAQLKTERTAAETTQQTLQAELAAACTERDALEAMHAERETQHSEVVDADVRSLRAQIRDARQALLESATQMSVLQEEKTELTARLSDLQAGWSAKQGANSAPRVLALEQENAKLKTALAKLKSDLQRMEADVRKSYNAKVRQIVTKLDEQQKERLLVEKGWMRNQHQLKDGYERQIRALSGELAGLKHTVIRK